VVVDTPSLNVSLDVELQSASLTADLLSKLIDDRLNCQKTCHNIVLCERFLIGIFVVCFVALQLRGVKTLAAPHAISRILAHLDYEVELNTGVSSNSIFHFYAVWRLCRFKSYYFSIDC
jgi:hypothetical protein